MTTNWEEEVKQIARYLGCNEGGLWSEISKLLEQKDEEHRVQVTAIISYCKSIMQVKQLEDRINKQ